MRRTYILAMLAVACDFSKEGPSANGDWSEDTAGDEETGGEETGGEETGGEETGGEETGGEETGGEETGGEETGGEETGGEETGGEETGGEETGGEETGGEETGGEETGGEETGGEETGGESGDDPVDDVFCDEDIDHDPIDECVLGALTCGLERPLISTTMGSSSNWGASEYMAWYCLMTDDPYDGPEAVFHFEHPGTGNVELQLHTPCDELDFMAIRWPSWATDDECPTEETGFILCDGSDYRGDDSIVLFETTPIDYLIVVDGPEGERANFSLVAECP